MTSLEEDKVNVETILPHGEVLRPLIVSSCLTKGDLRKVLAQRGVYTSSSEKEATIPILIKCLLGPSEFEFLRLQQRTREDNIKRNTQFLEWDSKESLIGVLASEQIPFEGLIPKDLSNCTFLGAPQFVSIGDNQVALEYTLERKNKTKDWTSAISHHQGKIIFSLNEDKSRLQINMEYTATETQDANKKIVKFIEKSLKQKNVIKNDQHIRKIKYCSFTNEQRIKFLLSLHGEDDVFVFKDVTNIEFGPEEGAQLPDEIKWMQDKVSNMIMKGNHLHAMKFIAEEKFHKSLILEEIEAKYEFEYSAAKGTCSIVYGFPDYIKSSDRETEFETRMSSLKLANQANKKKVEDKLMDMFMAISFKKFQQFSSK